MSDLKNVKELKEKYLSKADLKNLEDIKKSIMDDNVIVTCMGLYNHGKSTLLNSIIGDFENKTFKAADVRETTKNKKIKHENLTIVDTPGLNAQKNDDKRVMDAVKESDINIFAHNVTTGAFVEKEIEFFQKIKKHWKNPEEFCERTIFVLTKIDEVDDKNDIKNTHIEMMKQLKDIFNIKADIIPVSSQDYNIGKIDNVQELIDEGNIDQLKSSIETLGKQLTDGIKQTKRDRFDNLYKTLIQKLNNDLQTKELELSMLKQEKQKFDKDLKKDINKIQETLNTKLNSSNNLFKNFEI